jgi:predicted RNA-binding Zn-ribbon protein involved in translation (DUF1610 family)
MNTFPIHNSKYTSGIKSFYGRTVLPVFDWGKRIYVLLDNELCAMIPICVCAARNATTGDGIGANFYILVGCKIAGREGDRILKAERLTYTSGGVNVRLDGLRFFETPDDYTRYLNGDDSAQMTFPYIAIRDILEIDFGYQLNGNIDYTNPYQWAFDKYTGRPAKVNAHIKALWIDADGSHCELFPETKYASEIVKLYPSEEACRIANTAKVVDFEEPSPAPKAVEDGKTEEYCPHCDQYVKLDAELKVQTCPNCGKRIVTCSMCNACDSKDNYCTKCALCYQADLENEGK